MNVVCWQVKHDTFFFVLQDMLLEQQWEDMTYIDVNYRENRKTTYFLDMQGAVKEQQGKYAIFWMPIKQEDVV